MSEADADLQAAHPDIEGHLADAIRDTFQNVAGNVIDFETSRQMACRALQARPNTLSHDALAERKFWLFLRNPGEVPQRKGPWPSGQAAKVIREFIAANPTAYLDYVWQDGGEVFVEHAPEVLQRTDHRSLSTGAKHNERVRHAEAAFNQGNDPIDLLRRVKVWSDAVWADEECRYLNGEEGDAWEDFKAIGKDIDTHLSGDPA